jgi:hypothetical protein
MQSDAHEIVLQLVETILEQQRMICELGRNDLLLIESCRNPVSQAGFSAAAATVRSTLYSVDALADRIRRLDEQARSR